MKVKVNDCSMYYLQRFEIETFIPRYDARVV